MVYKSYNIENIFDYSYNLLIFQSLEDDIIEFLKNISMEYYPECNDRKYIYSPKLANLLINIGSRIDEFFTNWNIVRKTTIETIKNKQPNISEDKLNKKLIWIDLENYKDIERNKVCILSDKYIYIPRINRYIKPFENFLCWNNRENPCESWWCAYHNVKHKGYERRKEGNLDYVVNSLAALFLLNCMYKDISITPKKIHEKQMYLDLSKNMAGINKMRVQSHRIKRTVMHDYGHDKESFYLCYKSRLFNYTSSIKISEENISSICVNAD